MKDLVPLFQTALWPLLIVVVLLVNKRKVGRLLTAFVTRIEQGAPIKAAGLEIGSNSVSGCGFDTLSREFSRTGSLSLPVSKSDKAGRIKTRGAPYNGSPYGELGFCGIT